MILSRINIGARNNCLTLFVTLMLLTLSLGNAKAQKRWTATWTTAQQTPMKQFMPFNNCMTWRSVRQVVKVSAGGELLSLKISNEESNEPLVIKSVYIATSTDSFRIVPLTAAFLRFKGRHSVEIAPGKAVTSDAVRFNLKPLQRIAITINYKTAPHTPTVHQGSRTTSYVLKGYSSPYSDFSRAFREKHWFNIAALNVYNENVKGIAILGNSITDGKNSTDDAQNRWPDIMSEELNREPSAVQYGVMNLGIGGNCVIGKGSIGPLGKDRFNRDILEQHGVNAVIIFEGINDIGHSGNGKYIANELIEEYKIMIEKARLRNLKIYGATITPMRGAGYFSAQHEEARQIVNEWIRTSNAFDGVIDFDELLRDPLDNKRMIKHLQSDWLHPNPEGYRLMGLFAAEFIKKQNL
ncbi:MAG: SGNH/GDSL hydrolase family protein [Prevotella sp.]|jgi:lysophospholipase L1-like esterase|nr:SGNH/GDSL hydrolase family protein [Prevotella sp.]